VNARASFPAARDSVLAQFGFLSLTTSGASLTLQFILPLYQLKASFGYDIQRQRLFSRQSSVTSRWMNAGRSPKRREQYCLTPCMRKSHLSQRFLIILRHFEGQAKSMNIANLGIFYETTTCDHYFQGCYCICKIASMGSKSRWHSFKTKFAPRKLSCELLRCKEDFEHCLLLLLSFTPVLHSK
jgi:hypothetical protein